MSAPYWGSLPKSTAALRRVPVDNHHHGQLAAITDDDPAATAMDPSIDQQPQVLPQGRQQQQQQQQQQPLPNRSHRASVRTARTANTEAPTESTMSPFVSPTASSFAAQGLAPRPPSYPYQSTDQHPEFAEKRQRRRSQKAESLDTAENAQCPAGPSRSSRQAGPPTGTADDDDAAAAAASQPTRMPTNRRVSADVRSPLQKLELTLDSITKEEKRARALAAEQKAQERANANPDLLQPPVPGAQPRHPTSRQQPQLHSQPQSQPAHQQVRFRERTPSDEQFGDEPSHMVAPMAGTAAGALPHSSRRNPPARDTSEEGRRYGTKTQPFTRGAPLAAEEPLEQGEGMGIPQRNLSFRERAAHDDVQLPAVNGNGSDSNMANDPLLSPPVPAQNKSGFSFTRSGSKKLRKEPPGDPWFTRRLEMEKKYGNVDVGDRTAGGPAVSADPRTGPILDKPLPPDPDFGNEEYGETGNGIPSHYAAEGGVPSKAAKLMGLGGGVQRRSTAPTRRTRSWEDDDDDDPRYVSGPPPSRGFGSVGAAQRQGKDGGSAPLDDERRFNAPGASSRRNRTGQSNGVFRRPAYLDEWKNGTVGLLAGPQLSLNEEQLPVLDKNTPWWEGGGSRRRSSVNSRPRKAEAFDGEYDEANAATRFKPPLYLKCGPLLRYCGIRHETAPRSARNVVTSDREIWRGSVMVVTRDADSSYEITPTLRLFAQPLDLLPSPPREISGEQALSPEHVDPIAGIPKLGRRGETLYVRPVEHLEEGLDVSRDERDGGLFERTRSPPDYPVPDGAAELPGSYAGRRKRAPPDGEMLSKYRDVRGFRLHAERGCTFWRFNIEVELRDREQRIAYRINRGPAMGFWVPARAQSMNIMFHSCNGFSMGTNPDDFCGPDPMWRDVLNNHQARPFHVMIGGGDQVYNDCLIGESRLFNEWLDIRDPRDKHGAQFTPAMQDELESLYLDRYCMWFSQGLFGLANGQIPMVNMWDDHDISDGYGSYPDSDQNCPVFCGLGAVAFKYYMLFQQQSVPTEMEADEPSWVLGQKPGPYINELSRSLFMSLGSKVSLLAVDARTERTEHDVMSQDTWKLIMDRCYEEVKSGTTEHLLVLLGVPLAYPRLVWLENILTSRLMDPVKAMGKLGMLGSAFNRLNDGAEVMDDLNDHWTAANHKKERAIVVEDLQDLAADKSVRITILSGDVHLAAVGQFYANPKLGVPKHKDFRYMPNIISSAIANGPPPNLLADSLNKRNKVHHFDDQTDETMIPLFRHGVDGKARNNKHLLPHRNWCAIREWTPGGTPPPTPPLSPQKESPSPPPPQQQPQTRLGGDSVNRRLTKSRGPAQQHGADAPSQERESRPPLSGNGRFGRLWRRLSSRSRSRRSSPSGPAGGDYDERDVDLDRDRPPTRTMSLTRGDSGPRNLFGLRRGSRSRRDDGGINGQWGDTDSGDDDDDEYYDAYDEPRDAPSPPRQRGLSLRGGSGHPPAHFDDEFSPGDEDYFSVRDPARPAQQQQQRQQQQSTPPIRPFKRTPTGLTAKQIKQSRTGADAFEVDLEGGLDVTLNVEVNPRDPAGITVPYRLIVPRLMWDDASEGAALQREEEEAKKRQQEARDAPTGFKRFWSFRKKSQKQAHSQSQSQPPSQLQLESPGEAGPGSRPGVGVGVGVGESFSSSMHRMPQSVPASHERAGAFTRGPDARAQQQQQQQQGYPYGQQQQPTDVRGALQSRFAQPAAPTQHRRHVSEQTRQPPPVTQPPQHPHVTRSTRPYDDDDLDDYDYDSAGENARYDASGYGKRY